MFVKLNKWSKTKDILPLLDKEKLEYILSQVEEVPLKKPILEMSIRKFGAIVNNEEEFIAKLLKKRRLFKALGLLKSYKRQMNEIVSFFKMYDIKQTKEEKQAAIGIVFPDLVSRMLLTVTKFYHLKSMKQAERRTVSEYLIVFQEESSSLMYQRNYNNILNMQMKQKPKK